MSKLSFCPSSLNSVVIPSINQTIGELNSAIGILDSAVIPEGCNVDLSGAAGQISQIISNLNELKNWVSQSISILNNTESNYSDQANLLPKEIIALRNIKII